MAFASAWGFSVAPLDTLAASAAAQTAPVTTAAGPPDPARGQHSSLRTAPRVTESMAAAKGPRS
jgi:hypothetical protein